MTELRKGQRVWVEAEITDDSDVGAAYVRVFCGRAGAANLRVEERMLHPAGPTYLARREAMVRAVLASKGLNWQFDPFGLVTEADEALRAIDETPVPEWAGGGSP